MSKCDKMVSKCAEVTGMLIVILIVFGISIISPVLFHLPTKYYPRPEFLKLVEGEEVRNITDNELELLDLFNSDF